MPSQACIGNWLDNVNGGAEQLDLLSISTEKLDVIAIAKDAAESLSTSLQSSAGDILSHKVRLRISRNHNLEISGRGVTILAHLL